MKKQSKFIADFDSTTSVFNSLAKFLDGKEMKSGGIVPDTPEFISKAINSLPHNFRRTIYRMSGWYDAFPAKKIDQIKIEKLSELVIRQYPQKKYPGVMVGSANGAATYLCAALGIPFLPQTFLLPVRRKLHPDRLIDDLNWGKKHAEMLLKNNSNLQIHQMHDPVQDRLMVERMAYFRIKKLSPGKTYINFIKNFVEDGGTILISECTLKWPVTKVFEKHYFQSGGLGALKPGELYKKKDEIEKFLKEQGEKNPILKLPEPDVEMPEAEWGFLSEIMDDLRITAKEKKLKVYRIIFEKPDHLSPLIADVYKWWYEKNNIKTGRLIAECFALLNPLLTMKKACIPYWLAFNTMPSADAFEEYLNNSNTFDEIYIKLMSNGIKSIGIASVEKWESIIKKAGKKYSFLGMNFKKYPLDLGSYGRFHPELEKEVSEDYPLPEFLKIQDLEKFMKNSLERYKVIINRE